MLRKTGTALSSLSIRTQLLILFFIVALPSAGIIIYSGVHMRNQAVNDARMQTLRLADSIAAEQQDLITAAQQAIIILSQLPEVKTQNASRMQTILRAVLQLNTQFQNIFIADTAGRVWATAVPVLLHQNISDRRYFKNVLASGRLSSGEYIVSRATAKPAFNIAAPLKNNSGEIIGIICVGFKLDAYNDILRRANLPPDTSFILLDHNGVVLYRALNPEEYIGRQYDAAIFKQMQEGPDAATFDDMPTISGDRRVLTYRKMRLPGETGPYMYIRAGIPVTSVLADTNRALIRNLSIFTSFLALAIFFAWIIGKRSIADRIMLIEEASRNLAHGDLSVRVSGKMSGGELGRLGRSFDHMAAQMAEREQSLRESEELFRAIFYGAMDGIILLDVSENRFVMANKTMCDLLGCTEDRLRTLNPEVIHPADALPRVGKHMEQTARGEISTLQEVAVKRCDESIFYADITASSLLIHGKMHFVGVFRDVSARKRASEEQHKLVSIIETSSDLIGIADLEEKILYLNSAGRNLVGLDTREDIRSITARDFFFDSDYRTFKEEIIPAILKNDKWTGEITYRHFKTGQAVPVDMNCFLIRDPASGQPVALANISRDITERRQAEDETRKLQGQLLQSQKMESIGQLAGGIAHDFNNILSAIIGYGNILLMKLPAGDPNRTSVDHILESADRAAELTRSLLTFSRKHAVHLMPVRLNEIITGQELLLRRIIGEDIIMKTVFLQDPVILADSSQIQQILMNLATNARDAMPKGGRLSFETDVQHITDEFISTHGFGSPGSFAVISVTDTGIGMDEGTKRKIFEPFFTTKDVGQGTGLGMAIIYGIVKQHKGYIIVTSEPGKGSMFKIYLPLYQGKPDRQAVPAQESGPLTGTETVLLAEDDASLRTLYSTVLTENGYSVITAEDGEDAISKFVERKDDIRLCILDVIMPKKSGKDVFDAIRQMNSGVKVIFSSGYTADKVRQENLPAGIEFLPKPAQPQVLLKKMRRVLDGR
ncbi:MAG TPA: PAS domain S-box protein [Nitrospirota bacterium]|nr:PAS domain S-box protein [Nitrospirota bacterium]